MRLLFLLLILLFLSGRTEAATYYPFAVDGEGAYLQKAVLSALRKQNLNVLRVSADQYAAALNEASSANYTPLEWARFFEQGKTVRCSAEILSGGIQRLDRNNQVSTWNRPCREGEEILIARDDSGRDVGAVSLFCLNPIVLHPKDPEEKQLRKNCHMVPVPQPSGNMGDACGVSSGLYLYGRFSDACGMAGSASTRLVTICD